MFKTTSLRVLIGLGLVAIVGCNAATSSGSPGASSAATPAPSEAVASATLAAPVTFTYQTFVPKETDQVGGCIDEYVALNPNVTIDYQIVDHESLQTKLVAAAETGTLPDMFWWNGVQIVDSYNKTQAELDLTPYLDDAFKSTLIDGALDTTTTADGKIVGFPAEAGVQGWVFNKALFDQNNLQIPTTYDELKAVVPVFEGKGIDTIAYGAKEDWATWGFEHWFTLYGIFQQAEAAFKDGTLKTSDMDWTKAYEALAELYALGAFPKDNSTMSFDQAVALFNSGKAAMITLPSDQLGKVIGQPNEKDYVFNWGITFPDSTYPQDAKVRFVGNGYGISAKVADDPAKLDAIIAFNKWRYSAAGLACALKLGSVLPAKVTPDTAALGPIMTQQIALIQDPAVDVAINKGYPSAYASYWQWNSDGDIWTQGYQTVHANLVNSLLNGSLTAADIHAELLKQDATVAKAITQVK